MNVYRALLASRFVPKLAGAAPYELSRTSIRFSRIGQIWPLITSSIVVALLYLYRSNIPYQIGELKSLIMTLVTWLQYFVATFGVLKDGFRQQVMVDVVRSINNYDEKTGYNNEPLGRRENERVRFWSFVYSASLTAVATGRLLAWQVLDLDPATEIFVVQTDNSIWMFTVLTTLLGLRLRHLNSTLKQNRGIKVQSAGVDSISNPEDVRVLYTSLVTTGERLNDHYSSRLFLWTALITLATIIQYYFMLTVNMPAAYTVAAHIRLSQAILGLTFFSIACQFTTEQEILTMSLYMDLRPFAFSALGFFTVDLPLIHTIVVIVVTYLLLCLQADTLQ